MTCAVSFSDLSRQSLVRFPAMSAPVLSYEGLGLVQGSGWLFRELDVYVGERDRLALIGRNGAGKTTLFKLLANKIDSDEGRRTIVPGTNVVLLEQEPDLTGCETLRDYAISGDSPPQLHEVEAIADQLGIDLSRACATASAASCGKSVFGNPRSVTKTFALVSRRIAEI